MPYFYILKNKKYNKFYAGSRSVSGNPNDDLLKKYFTSSKTIKLIMDREGLDDWSIIYIKEFESYNECVKYEDDFLQKVKNKTKYFNMNFSAGGQVVKSKTHTFITKDSINYHQHDKTIPIPEGFYIEWPSRPPPRTGIRKFICDGKIEYFKIGEEPEGWILLSEYREKKRLSDRSIPKIWINNGIATKKIKKEDSIPDGWVRGKLMNKDNLGKNRGNWTTTKDTFAINDGKTNRFISKISEIPDGWRKGLFRNK